MNQNVSIEVEEIDPEAEAIAREQAAKAEADRLERLQSLGSDIQSRALRQITYRTIIEERWLEDISQYNGIYDTETEKRLKDAKKSRVFLNVTRAKTNIMESRIADMLFPTDDKNWEISPTPVPELMDDPDEPAQDDQGASIVDGKGAQMTRGQVAEQLMAKAKAKADKMSAEIDDQLTEANYSANARMAIHQACMLGTGVVKGPFAVGRQRRAWRTQQDGSWVIEFVDEVRPMAEYVDLWDFFPDMSAIRFEDCEFAFERKYYTKRQMQALRQNKYYIEDSIKKLLQQGPKNTRIGNNTAQQIRKIQGIGTQIDDNRYESWIYYGPVSVENLRDAGIEIPDMEDFDELNASIEVCGGLVLKAYINPLDTGELPFSMFVLERDETSIFGFGVPYLARDPQRVANSAWRMILDNGGLAALPQIVVDKTKVVPANGVWELSPGKIWLKQDEKGTVNDAFGKFNIDPHQQELTAILQDALQFFDQVINLPLIAQGQQTPLTKTAQGMGMLMNAANTVLRRTVKEWDDGVTATLLGRFYDWNMQYNPKNEIKGDFEVVARGASVLLAKEIQANNLMFLGLQFGAHPLYGPMMKPMPLLRQIVKAHHIDSEEVVLSDDEWNVKQQQMAQQQQQGQGTDPRVAAEQMRAESKMKELEYDRETHTMTLEAERENLIFKIAADQKMSVQKLQALLAQTQMKIDGSLAQQAREISVKDTFGTGL